MNIFSIKHNVKNNLTKEYFLQLLKEWLENSPHEPLKTIGEGTFSEHMDVLNETCRLQVKTLEEYSTIAARLTRIEDKTMWRTDIIFNYADMAVAINLSQDNSESTVVPYNYKIPYFLKLLIKKELIKEDVIFGYDKITLITKDNIELLENVIEGRHKLPHPLVYVSASKDNKTGIDILKLKEKLLGLAHIVTATKDVSELLVRHYASFCLNNGNICVYNTGQGVVCKKYYTKSFFEEDRIISRISQEIKYNVTHRYQGDMYTWDGIQTEYLRNANRNLLAEHLTSLKQEQVLSKENNEIIDIFGTQLNECDDTIESLTKKVQALEAENEGLRNKLYGYSGKIPLLYHGEEDEFYDNEIKEIILDALNNYKNGREGTRRYDLITDIISANDFTNTPESRKNTIKSILKGYTRLTNDLEKDLEEFGFEISQAGKHYKLTYNSDSRYFVTMAKSCSDVKAGNNLASEIAKSML